MSAVTLIDDCDNKKREKKKQRKVKNIFFIGLLINLSPGIQTKQLKGKKRRRRENTEKRTGSNQSGTFLVICIYNLQLVQQRKCLCRYNTAIRIKKVNYFHLMPSTD